MEGKISLYQSEKGAHLLTLEDEASKNMAINSLAFTSNSQFLASGTGDGYVKIWDLKKRAIANSIKSHFGTVTSTVWNHDDTVVASSSLIGDVVLHNVKSGITVANFNQKNSQGIKMVKFSPFIKNYLALAANDGSINILDVNTRGEAVSFPNAHNSRVSSLAFSTYNEILLCSAGLDKNINFYDIHQKKIVKTLETDSALISLAFYIDGHTIVAGSLYGPIMVFDLRASSKPKLTLKGHETNGVNYLDFIKLSEDSRKTVLPQDVGAKFQQEAVAKPPQDGGARTPPPVNGNQDLKYAKTQRQQKASDSARPISPLYKKDTLSDISNAQGPFASENKSILTKVQSKKNTEAFMSLEKTTERKNDFLINPVNNTFGDTKIQKFEEKEKEKPAVKSQSGSLLDPHDEVKLKMNAIDEIRREALLRIENKKKEKSQLSINTNNSSSVGAAQINLSKRTDEDPDSPKHRNSKGTAKPKDETAKTESFIKTGEKEKSDTANRYKPALEELNRRTQVQLARIEENEEFSEKQKAFLKNTLEENNNSLKAFFHENIQNLHVEIIRQFLIQQNDMSAMLEKYLINQQKLESKIQELQAENASLKKITY